VLSIELRTILSDGYGRTIDGQMTGMVQPSLSVNFVQQISNSYRMGMGMAIVWYMGVDSSEFSW
jgi:hypothetical protein